MLPVRGRSNAGVRALGPLLLAVLVCGCTLTFVHKAEIAYHEGRYLETAEDLAAHEPELATLPPARRARYGVFRGLALLRLGDVEGAHRWLSYAYDVERVTPTLPPPSLRQLAGGWAELERLGLVARPVERASPGAPPAPSKAYVGQPGSK